MAKLKRSLGLLELTMMGVGIIIGAGIYVLIGQAAGLAGNALWISFILAAMAAIFTGLSYAELSSIFPKSGAEYAYAKKTFGKKVAWMTGWLIVLNGFIGAATVSIGFANYFSALTGSPIILTALSIIVLSTIILFAGIKDSTKMAIILTILEVSGIIIIIFVGLPKFGSVDYLQTAHGLEGIFQAGTLIFFAFVGFETISRMSEETRNPKKTIPKAIILSIAITTILYILVALSAVSILGWETLSKSQSPMSDVVALAFGNNAFLAISLIALCSTANTIIVILMTTSRLIYGIAEFGTIPKIFSSVSKKNNVPWVSIIAAALPAMAFVMLGDLTTVANLANFTIFITFIIVNACVIKLRLEKNNFKGCFRTPFCIGKVPILPVLGIATCLFMLFGVGLEVFLYGIALSAIGIILFECVEFEINHEHLEKHTVKRKHLA